MTTKRVLVSDKIPGVALSILQSHFDVDVKTGLSEIELIDIISQYDALLVRSQTKVTSKIIQSADKLKIIARAGVGVDNVDVFSATNKGIVVVNSPEGNTVAAAELTFALLLSLARQIPAANNSLQRGEWKRNDFFGIELFGKQLGIIGLGKIGSRVARYAIGMGMTVVAYDPYLPVKEAQKIGVELLSLDEVLSNSNILTLHIPKNDSTTGMINKDKFAIMQTGVLLINCARGGIVVESDLLEAVNSGKVKGAAIDVFDNEPVLKGHILLNHKNIITTPHIGAVTKEARENVAIDVAEQIIDVLKGGKARSAVNAPFDNSN